MIVLEKGADTESYRHDLMQFLNRFGLNAAGVLTMARHTEAVRYDAGEAVLTQGLNYEFVYFLVQGTIRISLAGEGGAERRVLGERAPVTVLGEISFFNRTPATASVEVTPDASAVLLRVSYENFARLIEEYPEVRDTLSRIGEMRIISGFNGFVKYGFFMDQIGWRMDRFAVNRSLYTTLEGTVEKVLLPLIQPGQRLLEVGDGPGIVCEALYERRKQLLPQLHLQATHLEDAITDPHSPRASDLLRARFLRERFEHIVAFQVFNVLTPERVEEQLQLAHTLLNTGGHLLIIKLPLLQLHAVAPPQDARLIYNDLELLLERTWPGLLQGRPLIDVSFMDADLDAMMEWNAGVCEAAQGSLRVPPGLALHETAMLEAVLAQARRRLFNPDEVHANWLRWLAAAKGFAFVATEQLPDVSYFHLLLRRD